MRIESNRAVRAYLFWLGMVRRAVGLIDAVSTGFWLGVFRRSDLDRFDAVYYNAQRLYQDETYNRSGLRAWERVALERHFGSARRVLVTSAGGGREALALLRKGYEVDAFECNPALVEFANRLLAAEGFAPCVVPADRDSCPRLRGGYDGVIVGWGAFMLTHGFDGRVRLLRQLRALMRPGTPMLLSFFVRTGGERRFSVILAIANFLRRLQGREPVERGDDLAPNYVHHFDREEVERTLAAAGFGLALFGTEEYGHAVAIAQPAMVPAPVPAATLTACETP